MDRVGWLCKPRMTILSHMDFHHILIPERVRVSSLSSEVEGRANDNGKYGYCTDYYTS